MITMNRLIAGLRRRLRRALDYRVVRWYQLARYQQAWYLRRLFRWQEVDLVIDVGGNSGQFAEFIRKRVGYKGLMITFEPIPWLAAELQRRTASDPNWIVVNKALGANPGQAQFNVMNTSPMSSLLQPKRDSQSSMKQFNQVEQRVEVEIATLDTCLNDNPRTRECRNIYLKLDVQGYELEVLKGTQLAMSRICALQSELNVIPLYENQPGYMEVLRFLDTAGYVLSSIPAHDYEHFPEMIDFDCHFVRRDRLTKALTAPPSGSSAPVGGA
ncbi:FkbM family methyltransferase [Roseateles toxinivorans]|uniref:FkbM family methyltransferase n=1 Tax=Roseateles toxinivorans TaxID=270368 RepID=A0A4R6QMS8_9BURK|nr:FkbM family methyltransferase [Roseateles toxinivorans]TDP71430.1 FkbM family methyltransferase [Roseateles toxinivorans]